MSSRRGRSCNCIRLRLLEDNMGLCFGGISSMPSWSICLPWDSLRGPFLECLCLGTCCRWLGHRACCIASSVLYRLGQVRTSLLQRSRTLWRCRSKRLGNLNAPCLKLAASHAKLWQLGPRSHHWGRSTSCSVFHSSAAWQSPFLCWPRSQASQSRLRHPFLSCVWSNRARLPWSPCRVASSCSPSYDRLHA